MARSISKEEFDKLKQQVRVLIVTAMQVEADSVNGVLDAQPFVEGLIPLYQQFRFGYFGKFLAAHITCGQAGLRSSVEVTAALAELRGTDPSRSFYVLMPGICCGLKRSVLDTTTVACSELKKYLNPSKKKKLPEAIATQLGLTLDTMAECILLPAYLTPETNNRSGNQFIGDILVASSLWQHNYQAVKPDRTEDRGGRFNASASLLQLLLEHAKEWQETSPYADYGTRRCKVHNGLILSGDLLLNNFNRREELLAEYKDAIGLDMEGHGLGASVLTYTSREREGQAWFLFAKGICDWGVGKADGWQQKAAIASVSLLHHCLENPNFFFELIRTADKKAVNEIFANSSMGTEVPSHSRVEASPSLHALSTRTNLPMSRHGNEFIREVGDPATIFIGHSPKDKMFFDRVKTKLEPLVAKQQIKPWDVTCIQPGQHRQEEIEVAIVRAKIAVLLISADFKAEFSANEKQMLIDGANGKQLTVVPVILGPDGFDGIQDLASFQPVNEIQKPLYQMRHDEQETIWNDLYNRVSRLVNLGKPNNKVFLSMQMSDLDAAEYTSSRQKIINVLLRLRQNCDVYFLNEYIPDQDKFCDADLDLNDYLSRIRACTLFVAVMRKKVVSSIYFEVGYALAHAKRVILFVENRNVLPLVMRELPNVDNLVEIIETTDLSAIETIVLNSFSAY